VKFTSLFTREGCDL